MSMSLSEALRIIAGAPRDAAPRHYQLVCAFTPLHLKTFLAAHLQRLSPECRILVDSGLYGDLAGNLQRADQAGVAAAVFVEWPDLDPRLGLRGLGGWNRAAVADIGNGLMRTLDRLLSLIQARNSKAPLIVFLPALPIAPVQQVSPNQAAPQTMDWMTAVFNFGAQLGRLEGVKVANPHAMSAMSGRPTLDVKSKLAIGFPYTMEAAELLARQAAELLRPQAPKKGLITDLDNTLWSGVLGDDGLAGIAWTLDRKAQIHGLYQQLLESLAENGVLLAVASKNDSALAEQALLGEGMVLRREHLFPVEAHWRRKSESVGRILDSWNIGEDAVVFVDDSPMELDEVRQAFPRMQCLRYPAEDPAAAVQLLNVLRSEFGKDTHTPEDDLRAQSLVQAEKLAIDRSAANSDEQFLQSLQAKASIEESADFSLGRALELVNKTNQFNINGRRFDAAEWTTMTTDPNRFLVTLDYQDKYGPLGKIAVMSGRQVEDTALVDIWVLSCRAFSRRIEHLMLQHVFGRGVRRVVVEFKPTERNEPAAALLRQYGSLEADGSVSPLTRENFMALTPKLYHDVAITAPRR